MKIILLLILITFINIVCVSAQDTTTIKKNNENSFLNRDQNWAIEIPIWIPGFRGNFAYGDVSLEGEDGVDPGTPGHPIEPPLGQPPDDGGNILSRLFSSSKYLKFFFMGQVVFVKDKFTAQFDAFGGSVGSSVEFKLNNKEVAKVNYATALARLFLGYSLYELENSSQTSRLTIYGYAGMRVHYVELISDLNRTTNKLDINFFWGEAIVGIENRVALNDWLFILQGDIGGFYSGKNYSYMIQALCHYRLSNLLSIKLGWTDWDVNYKGEVKEEKLSLNVHLSGPSVGLAFHF